jgi:hypothetical protein
MNRRDRDRSFSTAARLLALVGVIVLSLSALAAVDASSARLRVPGQAYPGQTVRVVGQGFAPRQTGNLTYNGGVVRTFTASTTGSFNVTFKVPLKARVGARGRISAKTRSGGLLATSTLAIVSASDLSPTPSPTASYTTGNPSTAPSDPDATPTPVDDSSADPSAQATDTPSGSPSDSPSPSASASESPSPVPISGPPIAPAFDHVYVIVLENREYSDIVGSTSAPFLNSLVAADGASASFYAERHPSEPNYIALTSGGTQGVTDDGSYNLSVDNLFAQVSAAGRSWHVYAQGYPGGCFTGSSAASMVDGDGKAGAYVRKHNPAISYTSVSGNPAECARITGLAAFDPAAADLEFIVPNLVNDMHDGTTADGDNFLRTLLPRITDSPAFANSVVFITFDEGSSSAGGGGRILTIADAAGTTAIYGTASYSHYSILATIEEAWGLPYLGAASSAPDIDFTQPVASAALAPSARPSPSATASWPAGATASRMSLLTPCSDQAACYVYQTRAAGANGSRVNDDVPSIARFFGVSLAQVYAMNPWARLGIQPGQLLKIPPPTR